MSLDQEKRGKIAFSLHSKIVEREEQRRNLLALNAVDLVHMFESELYKDMLGDEDAPWAAYLGELTIFYSRNQINSYIKVYQKYTKELGVPPEAWVEVPITRLIDALPVVTASNWEEWMVKGKTLTTRDWNIELRQLKGLLTEEEHEVHDDNIYKICKQCGRKELVHDHD